MIKSFLFYLFFSLSLFGATSLLEKSETYITDKNLSLSHIIQHHLFTPYPRASVNIGVSAQKIWIKLKINNPTSQPQQKILLLTSPLLESITLYSEDNPLSFETKNLLSFPKAHHTLLPFYEITLPPHRESTYYLRVHSFFSPVDFQILLREKATYLQEDRVEQETNFLLIGFVFAFGLYSFLLFFYTQDKSYLYYSLYLFALIAQQMTYLGITQIHFPLYLVSIDIQIPILKVNLLIVTHALFAIHFLKINTLSNLHCIYKAFIGIAIIEMLIFSFPSFYHLNIAIVTGAFFIIFNLIAGILAYRQGQTQARLFILGFGIVFLSYSLIIFNALGLFSAIQYFRNILIFGTAFEALILSLAFADRYHLLQKAKAKTDARLLLESQNRKTIIEKEVIKKTEALKQALEVKEILLKEIHHRVKNNLQIILSIIRLQNDEIEDKIISEKFINLENRINAISKTYSMLLLKENLEKIDMQKYIDVLLLDIEASLHHKKQEIEIATTIKASLPLQECVYIGLIINELITNSYKYAFEGKGGKIQIALTHQNDNYLLIVQDNGKGFERESKTKTLGLKLIHTLVYGQLRGVMQQETTHQTKYTIRFTL